MKSKEVPSEHIEQVTLMSWAIRNSNRLPGLHLLHAIPNGGGRSKVQGAILKAEGVKRGVPDLFLPVRRGECAGLYIEMKRKVGGRVSPEQKEFMNDVVSGGYRAEVCNGADEAISVIEDYYGEVKS